MNDLILAAAAAHVSKDVLTKLFGPSAELIGDQFRGVLQRGIQNVGRVLKAATRIAQETGRLDAPGEVNPRVAKGIIDESFVTEDPLVAEYLGGILASSKSEGGRDDRGVAYVATVRSLSSYQLRIHHLLYTSMMRKGKPNPKVDYSQWCLDGGVTVFYADEDLREAMDYRSDEDHSRIIADSLIGLQAHGLHDRGRYSPTQNYKGGLLRYFWPTIYGFNLYAWAHGQEHPASGDWFDMPVPSPLLGSEFEALAIEPGYQQSIGSETLDALSK